MRLGFVYLAFSHLAMLVGLPMGAAGQWQEEEKTGVSASMLASKQAMTRADGTVINPGLVDGRMADRSASLPPKSMAGAISFRHYVHQPAKAARKSFEKAVKAIENAQRGEALDRLNDALLADPEFFDAHLETAILWIAEERPDQALPHLERALAIDSSSQIAQGLAAWVLLQLNRAGEAEMAARRSLQLGRNIPILEKVIEIAQARRKAQ